jgi:hypothetical protein
VKLVNETHFRTSSVGVSVGSKQRLSDQGAPRETSCRHVGTPLSTLSRRGDEAPVIILAHWSWHVSVLLMQRGCAARDTLGLAVRLASPHMGTALDVAAQYYPYEALTTLLTNISSRL